MPSIGASIVVRRRLSSASSRAATICLTLGWSSTRILGSPARAASMRCRSSSAEALRRRELALREVLLAVVLGLGVDHLALRRLDVLTLGAPLGAQAADLGALDVDVRLDLGKRQPVGRIVEPVEQLGARDALVLAHP